MNRRNVRGQRPDAFAIILVAEELEALPLLRGRPANIVEAAQGFVMVENVWQGALVRHQLDRLVLQQVLVGIVPRPSGPVLLLRNFDRLHILNDD